MFVSGIPRYEINSHRFRKDKFISLEKTFIYQIFKKRINNNSSAGAAAVVVAAAEQPFTLFEFS